MKFFDPKRHLPPGWDWENLRAGLLWGHGASLASLFIFVNRYLDSRASLYSHIQQLDGTLVKQLIPGRTVAPFWTLLAGMPLWGMWIFWILMGVQVWRHYSCHTRDSMPIYLMRRLPDKWELHRRCWTVPVLACLVELLVFAVGIGLCWLLWYVATPAGCLPL